MTFREANVSRVLADYALRDADLAAVVTRYFQEQDEASGKTEGRVLSKREWFVGKGKRVAIVATDRGDQGLERAAVAAPTHEYTIKVSSAWILGTMVGARFRVPAMTNSGCLSRGLVDGGVQRTCTPQPAMTLCREESRC